MDSVIRIFRFYKEPDNRWYVDLPDWDGEKAALEMVAGADTMLEHIAKGKTEVTLKISEKRFKGSYEVKFKSVADDIGEGAYYFIKKYKKVELNLNLWLCDVVKHVFYHFPKSIFIIETKSRN